MLILTDHGGYDTGGIVNDLREQKLMTKMMTKMMTKTMTKTMTKMIAQVLSLVGLV